MGLYGWLARLLARRAGPPQPGPGRAPVRLAARLEPPVVRRLDPPGLLGDGAVIGATAYFWQYQFINLLVFERGRDMSLVVATAPQYEGARERPRERSLERLPGTPWAGSPGQIDAEVFVDHRATLAAEGPRIDLAPRLHAGLLRLAEEPAADGLAGAISFLDLLATFRGLGSQEFAGRPVVFGEAALERLAALVGRAPGTFGSVIRFVGPELAGGPSAALRGALRGPERDAAGAWRATALVEHADRHDTAVGGYREVAALATLRVDARGWSYSRRELWSEEDDGIEMS